MRFLSTLLQHCCLKKTMQEEESPSPAPPPSDEKKTLHVLEAYPAFEFTFAKISSSSSFNLTPAQAQEIGVARETRPVLAVTEPLVALENEGKTKYIRKKKGKKKKRRKKDSECGLKETDTVRAKDV